MDEDKFGNTDLLLRGVKISKLRGFFRPPSASVAVESFRSLTTEDGVVQPYLFCS